MKKKTGLVLIMSCFVVAFTLIISASTESPILVYGDLSIQNASINYYNGSLWNNISDDALYEGNANTTGNMTADYFIGNGSLLTGISGGSGDGTGGWTNSSTDTNTSLDVYVNQANLRIHNVDTYSDLIISAFETWGSEYFWKLHVGDPLGAYPGNFIIYQSGSQTLRIKPSGNVIIYQDLEIRDTDTGGNAGTDLCIGSDNKICACGSCA